MRTLQLFIKRGFDILVSAIAVIILLPFWLIIVIIMKITMPGPVFFRQERIGRNFVAFDVLKFRSMTVDTNAEKNFDVKKDVQRTTSFGKLLRRSKLDETPQMLNILKGDMSIVGPRPTVRKIIEQYPERQEIRLSMRPGLTGISQVSGNVLLSWPRRIEYDCMYVKEFSIWKDIVIIFKTVLVVLIGEEKFISEADLKNHRNPNYDLSHKKK